MPIDSDGWTVLRPSADSKLIYISSSEGSDANDGLSEATPQQSIAKAIGGVRNGMPDWLLLKRGDTFTEGRKSWYKGGRSAAEPMVITGYGEGPRPVLNGTGLFYYGPNGGPDTSMDYLAIVGLDFHADHLNHPSDLGHEKAIFFVGGLTHLLLEDNSFSGYRDNISIQYASGGQPISDITIRRNVAVGAKGQGLYVEKALRGLLEENVFDNNGRIDGAPNVFRHNVYAKALKQFTARGNIFSRASNFGLKMSADEVGGFTDFVVRDNLFYDNGISADHSAGPTEDTSTTYTHHNGLIENNVFTEVTQDIYDPDGTFVRRQDLVGWLLNSRDLTWNGNLFVHKPDWKNDQILTWASHSEAGATHKDVAVTDNIVYDWASTKAYLDRNAETKIDGFTMSGNQIDLSASDYSDPTRTVGRYYQSIGGTDDPVAFMTAARSQRKGAWDVRYTAAAVNDYIRAGFMQV